MPKDNERQACKAHSSAFCIEALKTLNGNEDNEGIEDIDVLHTSKIPPPPKKKQEKPYKVEILKTIFPDTLYFIGKIELV